jgi:hypothetical protein
MSPLENLSNPKKLLFLVNATDKTQRKAWYYILVQPDLLSLFKRKMATKSINLSDYGTIIESGYGETPPADIIKMIEDKFVQSAEEAS